MKISERTILHYSGVHRSGKTTDAIEFAHKNDHIFMSTNFSDITGGKGFNVTHDVLKQEQLMQRMMDLYLHILRNKKKTFVVLDRSMLDIMAYSVYYQYPTSHIKNIWYQIKAIHDLCDEHNMKLQYVHYDHPLVHLTKPEEAKKFNDLLISFYQVRNILDNYEHK